jgi:hypothetical protein
LLVGEILALVAIPDAELDFALILAETVVKQRVCPAAKVAPGREVVAR